MFFPVLRSITVSAPHLVAQRIFSTSSSMDDATALLPMLALIFTRKLRPMIIGSVSGSVCVARMMARPAGRQRCLLADGDEFHLGRDDTLARIPELSDGMSGTGAERTAAPAFE